MSEVNVPLLRKAVEWVEEQAKVPEVDREWRQQAWRTSGESRAVQLAVFAGVEMSPRWSERASIVDAVEAQLENHCGTAYCVAGYVAQMLDARYAEHDIVDGVHVSRFAAEALRIPYEERTGESPVCAVSSPLFTGDNTAEDVRRAAEQLAGERL